MVTLDQVLSAFTSALANDGITLSDLTTIKPDGQWHRAHVVGDKPATKRNLSYKIYFDDQPAGFYQDHKRGVTGTFSVRNGQDLDPAARELARAEWARIQREREQEQAAAYQQAATSAARAIQDASPVSDHAYLARKQIAPTHGLRALPDGHLVVPLYSEFGRIASYQTISPDGDKLFLQGGRIAGSFHPIPGTDKRRVLICEGYATGAALNAATGHPVVCAMSANNLPSVTAKMRAKFPDREVIVMADNDHATEKKTGTNPGVKYAHDTNARVLAPAFPADAPANHTDWDDWLRGYGTRDDLIGLIERGVPAGGEGEQRDGTGTENAATSRDTSVQDTARPVQGQVVDLATKPDKSEYGKMLTWSELGLAVSDKGVPHANLDNATALLERHPEMQGRFWYDEFLNRILSTWNIANEPREWTDADDVRLALWMQRRLGIGRMAVGTARDAVTAISMAHTRNECREWLESIQWDGRDRLQDFIPIAFGADANPYTSAVGRCWLTSMVARVLKPGCKVDTMPVFEGDQGLRKSTAMQALVGTRWFAEAAEDPTSKDFFQTLQGKMLVEIAELDAFSKSETTTIKRVITCQVDRYRAPYGRRAEDHPRMCVFAGTTNKDDWNKDETGARRFWPIACTQVDVEWIIQWREQLFAEAVARYKRGEAWWDVPLADAKREQEARRDSDEWEAVISPYLLGKQEVTVGEILARCLNIEQDKWDRLVQVRVGKALRALDWDKKVVWRAGRPVKVFCPKS